MTTALEREFAAAIAGRDHEVDLFGAAMLIARLGSRVVDPHRYSRELDLIAEAAADAAADARDDRELAAAVDHELFTVCGFRGNEEGYYDPENSYLDRVIERRTGLPITLSLVYMEVAQRIGLRCDGVGYPGHFLVRCGGPEGFFVDAFHGGRRRERDELLEQLGSGGSGANADAFLAAVTRRQILQRMLTNLRVAYRRAGDLERWAAATGLQLCIEPWNASLVGERGLLHYRRGDAELALVDLERYVESGDSEPVPEALSALGDLRSPPRSRGDVAMTAEGSTTHDLDAMQKRRAPLQRSIAWYLRQLSRLMSVVTDEELERLVPYLSERRFEPRQFLYSAGDPPERVYLLLKGRVKIYHVAENGKEVILDVVEKGGLVGDMAIIEGDERATYARAIEDTAAVSISWDDFQHVVQRSPRLAFAMAELMARRLSGMQRTFMNLVSKPVSARLAGALIDRTEDGAIELGLTHEELAQTLGTSRETVTALLSRFVTLGAILPAGGAYRVSDPALLREIASGAIAVSPRHPVGREPSAAAP